MNEEVDPALVIERLKREIVDLKQEIRLLRGDGEDEESEEMTEEAKETFRKELIDYCNASSETRLNLNRGMLLLRYGTQQLIQALSLSSTCLRLRNHEKPCQGCPTISHIE